VSEVPSDKSIGVFVVSPIGDVGTPTRVAADQVLRHIVRRALPPPRFIVERADEADNPGAITSRVVTSILEADLVVVDLSGHNPNVFYEAAIAHGYNKPTVHLQVEGETLAFDFKDMNTIRYKLTDPDSVADAADALARAAMFALANPDKVDTPLAHAQRFLSVNASSDPTDNAMAEIIRRLDGIERRLPATARDGAAKNAADELFASTAPASRDVGADRSVVPTALQRQILQMRADGASYGVISNALGLTESAIVRNLRSLANELGVESVSHLRSEAERRGWIV
jgi:DNA-binding NarL/FixJ family response regulator